MSWTLQLGSKNQQRDIRHKYQRNMDVTCNGEVGGEGAEEEIVPEEIADPNTRAQFQLLRQSYGDTDNMVEAFLHDHEHHLRIRILTLAGDPLHHEYAHDLKMHKGGVMAKLHFQADRSNSGWFRTVLDLAALLQEPRVLESLEMRAHDCDNEPLPRDDPSDTDLDYSQRFLRSLAKKLAQVDVAARQFQQGEEKKLVNELTASCLLVLGHVYLNVDSNSYILSLGFVQYCVLALRLTKKVVHGAVYFFVNMVSDSKLPTMVVNLRPGRDSSWRHVLCEVVPPVCAGASAVCLKQTSPVVESLLPSALLSKVFLTKPQLEKCLQSEGIAFPVEGSKGRIIKRDIANALVDHVFADKPEDVRGQVLNRLARDSAPEPEQDMEDCPIEILQVINEMDQDNKDHFQGVLKQAANLLAKRVQAETERNARRRAGQQQAPGAGRAGGAEAPANEAAAAGPALDPAAAAANAAEDAAPHAGAAANAAEPAAPAVGAEAEQDSPRRRANLGRAKAPEEFRSLLPPLGHLHFYYQPRQRRVVVEFASILSGEDADDEDKVASIVKVFTWCASQYHAKFADTDGYDSSYTAHLDPHKTYCY
eukprot:s961_g13.t1